MPLRMSSVVITRNRAAELERCLASLVDQDYPDHKLVVVDNASTDGTAELVRGRFPQARLVVAAENLGVSGGRNLGFQSARGDVCLAIDDDARLVDRGAVRAVAEYFTAEPRLGALALTIHQGATGQEDPKAIPRRDKRALANDYECSYFCGAGFAVRRELFLQLGQFWEPLVYGSQELDLAYRLLDGGWHIRHAGRVVVEHHEAAADRPRGQYVYFNARDRLWVAARHLPWRYVVTTALLWWLDTGRRAANAGEFGPWLRGVRDSWAGLPAALRGRRRIRRETLARLADLSGRLWY